MKPDRLLMPETVEFVEPGPAHDAPAGVDASLQWQSARACMSAALGARGLRLPDEEAGAAVPDSQAQTQALRELAQAAGGLAEIANFDDANPAAWRGLLPLMGRLADGRWVLITDVARFGPDERLTVFDPLALRGGNSTPWSQLPLGEWRAASSGLILALGGPPRQAQAMHLRQGLSWFMPALRSQRDLFRGVVGAVLALHLLGLAVPVFVQLVIDKVLVHHGIATLQVLLIGVSLALLFDALFSYMRQHFLLWATTKVDLALSRSTFAHLLALPVSYFEQRTAGVVTRNLQQVEKVRQFLTGRLLGTALDATVLLVFLPVLFFYSALLTAVVLAFAALMGLALLLLMPAYSRRLRRLYEAEGQRQAMLVESVQGIRTIKSLALERQRTAQWEERSASAVGLHLQVGRIAVPAQVILHFLEKALMVAVIGIGALLVFEQQLSVGALIAFQILSGRVTGPLVQLVSLIHEFQDTSLSLKMIGDVMEHPTEADRSASAMTPALHGRVEFAGVTFRYPGSQRPSLDNISFNLPIGKTLGVVGRSGSGKTTLTRLLLGMYTPDQGVVRLDGTDIRNIDLQHLRRRVGIVLQDSFLFRGTVRENIAVGVPLAPFEDIVRCAQLAGADEFIERLPRGYDTLIEENGANLSGGQRQRLAIARALLPDPRVLILDEAASALDPESEAIVLDNLGRIARGRTVVMISHRLTTLTGADAIMVMHQGRILDAGRHEELLQRCQPYLSLWRQQLRGLHPEARP